MAKIFCVWDMARTPYEEVEELMWNLQLEYMENNPLGKGTPEWERFILQQKELLQKNGWTYEEFMGRVYAVIGFNQEA